MAFSYLPSEILTDILLRVPTETLSKARFVNKYLLQFISSSYFVTAHLQNSKKNKTLTDWRIILPTSTCNEFLVKRLSVDSSLSDSSSFDLVSVDYPKTGSDSVSLEGSCNGLVCMVSKKRWIFLWNPCTGKYNKIHPPSVGSEQRAYINYGIGYDESSDDYKVVVACLYSLRAYKSEDKDRSMVHVYSLKSNSWKRIQDFDGGVLEFGSGKLVSGKLHWFTSPQFDKRHQRRIASFDVGSEVFGVLELPAIALDDDIETTLDVLEGCICLLLGYAESHADLWIMKEYGVKNSWEKLVTVSYENVFMECDYVCPWSVFPNGELLFQLTSNLSVVYNPKDGSLRHLYIRSMDYGFQPLVYVPSLVSPVGMHLKARFERKLQKDLTDELIVMARKLKESSLLMSQSIKDTEKILDSTEKAVGHNLATTGHANTRAMEVYSQSSKTSCLAWLPMFSMICIFSLFVLLTHVT